MLRIRFNAFLTVMAAVVGTLLLIGCAGASLTAVPAAAPSILDPQGPFAASAAGLARVVLIAGAIVFVVSAGLIVVASWLRRSAPPRPTPGDSSPSRAVPIAGLAIPAIVLLAAFGYTLSTASALPSSLSGAYVVEVTGHQWWWEVRYPDAQVTTANEIHIPVGRPVELRETSIDVIHSLWIPQLGAKMDLLPGRQTSTMIQASQPGTYRGQCAEFCGIQHAHMDLVVVADPPAQFAQWLAAQQVIPPAPTDPHLRAGQQAFLGSACVYCHTIRGTDASGKLGPDLTHLASRATIGAGMLANSRGNLAGWIANAQGIKPGNLMPPIQLDGNQLQAILDYLGSLK